jgi:hypothetical protein
VRERLLRAPAWVQVLINGGVFGLGMALVNRFLDGNSWTGAVVAGLVVGVLFGAVTGPVTARNNRRVIEAAGYLPPGQLGRAVRLTRRGEVPEDPELRRAARRIAQHDLAQLRGRRWWALTVVVLLTALSLWLAFDGGEAARLGWLGAVFSLALLAAHLLIARHLARRAELLADPPA